MNKYLMITMIVAVGFFSSMHAVGVALADSGQLAGCGAPSIFKHGGIGVSIGATWWLGEQIGYGLSSL